MLKRLALTAALLCTSAHAVSVDSVNVLRGFDGRAAQCKTQDDFVRLMRTGAYIVSNLEARINDDKTLGLEMNVTSFACVKKEEGFEFERTATGASLSYNHLRFNDGVAEEITVTVEKKDVELIAVSDDYSLLATSAIVATRNGNRAELNIDLEKALNLAQATSLDNGETIKLRVGLLKRAKVRHIAPDYVSSFEQRTGGIFYAFISLRKDQDKISIELH